MGRLPCSLLVAGVLLWAPSAGAEGAAQPPAPAGAAAQKACVDPATGRLVSPEGRPDCRTLPGDTQAGSEPVPAGQSAEGLAEEGLPQGGAKVDLKGRFQQDKAAAPPTPGGRVAILDPRTGALTTGEAAALMRRREDLRPAMQEFERQLQDLVAQSQNVSGLEEQQLQSGAVKVDLEGRFQSPLVARVAPAGEVTVRHETAAGR
jgi:hypothetical protein